MRRRIEREVIYKWEDKCKRLKRRKGEGKK